MPVKINNNIHLEIKKLTLNQIIIKKKDRKLKNLLVFKNFLLDNNILIRILYQNVTISLN